MWCCCKKKTGEKVSGKEKAKEGIEPVAIILIALEGDSGLELGIRKIHI